MEQNAYFHVLLEELAPHTPFPPQELKELLKAEWLGFETKVWRGKTYNVPIPSSSLDKRQYSLLLEKLLMLFAELGVQPQGRDYFGLQTDKKPDAG